MTGSSSGSSLWTGPREDPRRYRVDLEDGTLRHVGDGGEGLVFRASWVKAGVSHDVALKMHTALAIADFDDISGRARVLGTVDHPHVIHLIDAFVGTALIDADDPSEADFGVIYTASDWIPGEPLGVALALAGPVRAMRWMSDLARAVAHLHSGHRAGAPEGLVHRDIKPSNVRITPAGEAVLIDFGIARPFASDDMTHGAGTYLWQAPEVVGGPGAPGPASDVWGIGAVAYWILSGEPPRFDEAVVARRRLEELARQAGFSDPAGLGRHIARLLDPHPDDRVRDLRQWGDELDVILAGQRPHRWSSAAVEGLIRHSRLAIMALSLVLLLAVAVTTVAVYSGRRHAENLARAGELAAQSVNTLPSDVRLGSLLSIESAAIADTTQTHDAIVTALEQPVDRVLGAVDHATTFAYSPNGSTVAVGTRTGVVLLSTASGGATGRHHLGAGPPAALAFNADGSLLAAADGTGVAVWHVGPGGMIGQESHLDGRVSSIAFDPEQDVTLAMGHGHDVTLWTVGTGIDSASTLVDQDVVTSMAFGPDGTLAIGNRAGTVSLWDTVTGLRNNDVLAGVGSPVTHLAFSADGSVLAGSGTGEGIVLWSTTTETEIGQPLPDGNRITSLAFEPVTAAGLEILASGTVGGNAIVWNIADTGGPTPTEFSETLGDGSPIVGLAYDARGTTLAVTDSTGATTVWKTHSPLALTKAEADPVTAVAFEPGGTVVAGADTGGGVNFWNAETGKRMSRSLTVTGGISGIAIDPNGKTLATGDHAGTVDLWSISRATPPDRLRAGRTPVYSVAISPDGTKLASGSAGDVVRLWHLGTRVTGTPALPGHSSIRSLSFSPDGALLAAGNDKGAVVLWNTVTRKQVGSLTIGSRVNSVAFSPDGTLLATGDDAGSVDIWNVATRRKLISLDDRSSVSSVTFSPNGKTLATGDAFGDVIPWDVATGTEVGPSLTDGAGVISIAFSPDGTTLASGDDSGKVLLFPASFLSSSTDALATQLCHRVRGNLTRHQWAQYLPGQPYRKVCPAYG